MGAGPARPCGLHVLEAALNQAPCSFWAGLANVHWSGIDDAVGSLVGWRKVKTRTGAGSARLVDDLQVLDASRSYVPGSLWAGLANGRGNFTDGAGLLCFCSVHACCQQGAPHYVVSAALGNIMMFAHIAALGNIMMFAHTVT